MKTKLLFLLCLLPLAILAQTNEFTPGAADEKVRDLLGKYSLVKALLIPVTTVLVMLARRGIGKIPDQWWPILTPLLGAFLDWVGVRAGFWTGAPEVGLAVGGLSVWLNQAGKQVMEAYKNGFSTTKSGATNAIGTPPK